MFKKLKHRFILTNMAMLSVVLLLSFAAVYLITAYQIQKHNLLKLENIHSTTLRYQEAYERNDSFQMVGVAQEYADAFGVIVDEQNQHDLSEECQQILSNGRKFSPCTKRCVTASGTGGVCVYSRRIRQREIHADEYYWLYGHPGHRVLYH